MESCFPRRGPVAQLGARLNGIQEVTGSIPVRSTILRSWMQAKDAHHSAKREGGPVLPANELRMASHPPPGRSQRVGITRQASRSVHRRHSAKREGGPVLPANELRMASHPPPGRSQRVGITKQA